MADRPESGLYGQKFQILVIPETGGNTEAIIADGAIRETHADAAVLTRYPIGNGAPITDHHVTAPSLISVDLIITDTPIDTPESAVDPGYRILGQKVSVRGASFGSVDAKGPSQYINRGRIMYDRLYQLMTNAERVSVVTSRRAYIDVVITRLEMPVDSHDRSTIISIDFEQIRFAESEQTEIKRVSAPKLLKKKSKNDGSPTPETGGAAANATEKKQQLRSLADNLKESIFGA